MSLSSPASHVPHTPKGSGQWGGREKSGSLASSGPLTPPYLWEGPERPQEQQRQHSTEATHPGSGGLGALLSSARQPAAGRPAAHLAAEFSLDSSLSLPPGGRRGG